ncbi:MAG: hypothetical protein KF836_07225 [Fimbriimonadaceae bacterium]|nr:hypothetical protein [Fimbriimonadaceae bacterium]
MMDQEGCVNINGKIAQLSDAQLSKVIYQIRESLPYNDLRTSGVSEQSQVNNGGFSTSVRTTQSVYIAVNDFKKLKRLSDAELEFCRIAVEDAGEKVVVNISLPSESIRQELYGMPAKPVVSYTLLKSSGQIFECKESH